jgi:hypothetical protein
MEKMELLNIESGQVVLVDVLEQSDRRIKVAIGTGANSFPLTLTRVDTRRPYVGRVGGMEFSVNA